MGGRMKTQTIRVRFDGAVYPVRLHYAHWIPVLCSAAGVSLGTHIYLRRPYPEPSSVLLGHELVHTLDFVRRWNRTPLALYWLAVVWDVAAYVASWMAVGFRYRRIPEEVRAYEQQYRVAMLAHPDIDIVGTA